MSEPVNEYQRAAEQDRRDQLVLANLPLVRHVLGRLVSDLPPGVDLENLESAGVLGLVEAATRFDPARNARFSTYAYLRVRGAILDELRRNSVFPQQVLERIAAIRRARRTLPSPVTVASLARATGLSEDEVADTLVAMRLAKPATLDDSAAEPTSAPEAGVESHEQLQMLTEAIAALPEQKRLVLTLYYREDLRLREISAVVGLSVSRVSRLLTTTVHDLRESLRARGQESVAAALAPLWE